MKNSLSVKYTFFSILMIVIMTSTFTIVFVQQHSRQLKENLINQAKSNCTIFEPNLAEFLSVYKMDRIREQIQFLKQNPVVEYVYVLDPDGKVLMDGTFENIWKFKDTPDEFNANVVSSTEVIVQENDTLIEASIPIKFGNRHLGFLRIGHSKSELKEDVNNFIRTAVWISFSFILLTAIITYFIMLSISKPLRTITKVARNIADGEFNTKIEVKSRDEVMQLAKAFNEMSDKLATTQNSLLTAKLEAEKSNQLKTEFLAQISHEIRTPINSMLSFSSLLEDEFDENIDDDIRDYFKIMRNAGSRITRTVDLILNMAEIQKGTYEPNFCYFNVVDEILIQLKNEFTGFAQEKKLDLRLTNKSNNSRIYADQYTITQVFQNLIDNAIKYTNNGFVNITIEDTADTKLKVSIIDSGIGISQEFINHLFEPFRQEQQGYTRTYEGAGLGLSLVKNYCELNKAEIKVSSEKDVGSEFSVFFKRNA